MMKHLTVFLLVPLLSESVPLQGLVDFLKCDSYGVKCLNKNTFTFCSKSSQFIIVQLHSLKCPNAYICQETSEQPCVPDSDHYDDSNEISTITEPFISTTTELQGNLFNNPPTMEPMMMVVFSNDTFEEIKKETTSREDSMEFLCTSTPPPETEGDDYGGDNMNFVLYATKPESETISETGDDTFIHIPEVGEEYATLNESAAPITNSRYETTIISETLSTKTGIIQSIGKSDGPPECTKHDYFPGPTCKVYYECEMFWLFWYRPVLKKCPERQNFSIVKSSCVPTSESECID